MAQLQLFRGLEIISRFFVYQIYIDNEYVGQLDFGEQKDYPLAEGKHCFQIKSTFISSQIYKFEIQENQSIILEVKLSSVIEKLVLILFSTIILYQIFYRTFSFSYEISILCLLALSLLISYSLLFYRNKIIWIYRIEAH